MPPPAASSLLLSMNIEFLKLGSHFLKNLRHHHILPMLGGHYLDLLKIGWRFLNVSLPSRRIEKMRSSS